ncbi:MAG: PAS domain S-box protein [Deltaproteobacteria bacterium]|nr:PAS domain S-box protein [Deltaproteobacteria bacterium]
MSEHSFRFSGNPPLPFYSKLLLRHKLLLGTLVHLIIFGLLGAGFFYWLLKTQLTRDYVSNFRVVAESLSYRTGSLIQAGDSHSLSQLLQHERDLDHRIVYLIATGPGGQVLAHTFRGRVPPSLDIAVNPEAEGFGTGFNKVTYLGRTLLEVGYPVNVDGRIVGVLRVGVSTSAIAMFWQRITLFFLLMLAAFIGAMLLFSWGFFRYITRPILTLTRVADSISVGNLDVEIDFGFHVNCWELKQCSHTDCGAYMNSSVQCWFVDGTPCEGYDPRFPQKLAGCRRCEVYQAHRGDELVQLADSFKHMVHVLKISRRDLEKSNSLQKNLINNSFDGIIAGDETGTVRIFNRMAQVLTGYSEEEVIGTFTLSDFFDQDLSHRIDHPLHRGKDGVLSGFLPTENFIKIKDAEPVAVRLSGITLMEEGRRVGRVLFFQDLREIKKLRRELIQSERLAATGQTVASVSHSIKNILVGFKGGVYVYKRGRRLKDDKLERDGWRMIEKNIQIISELVVDLLNYAKDRQPILQECDPREVLHDVLDTMMNKAHQNGVELEGKVVGDIGRTFFDPHAIHQCLVNLVSNAIDAVPPDRTGHVAVSACSGGNGGIEFTVTDNGTGMSPEIQDKILRGMFSTKGSKGTGLGLMVVQKIVSEHKGRLKITSEAGRGATFRIILPGCQENGR